MSEAQQSETRQSAGTLPQGPLYRRAYKSIWLAYLFLLVASGVGLHRFYLGYRRTAAVQLALFVLAMVLAFSGFGPGNIAFFAILGWVFVDLFMLPWLTRWRNEAIAAEITRSLPPVRPAASMSSS
ncbi:TM2 domain-containing protein [Aliihoeflea sp. PC F10.4]